MLSLFCYGLFIQSRLSKVLMISEVVITPAANKLKTLNPTKSEVPDRIPPSVLLELQRFIYIPLTILFNNSIEKRIHSLRFEKCRNYSHLKNALRVIQQTTDQQVLHVLSKKI